MEPRIILYSGNDPGGWPYRVNGRWQYERLNELFTCGAGMVALDVCPWADVPDAQWLLRIFRGAYPTVKVAFVIRGPNGWNGMRDASEKAWPRQASLWKRLCAIRDQYPLRLPSGAWQPNVNIDMRGHAAESVASVLATAADGADALILDQWYRGVSQFGFDVKSSEWMAGMDACTRELSTAMGDKPLFANTGGVGRADGATGQVFEHWPNLPGSVGGYPYVLKLILPNDILMLMAGEPWVPGKPPSEALKLRARALMGTALYEDCWAGAAGSMLKPDGTLWAPDRGHAPWDWPRLLGRE